jgi:glycosyltransferase involved in cell wall biosynthesis
MPSRVLRNRVYSVAKYFRDTTLTTPEDSLKIVLVHNSYQQPGGEDAVFAQERQMLERAGHKVIPYCRSNWEVESYKGIRQLSLAKGTIWASDSRREFLSLLQREKPDLAHVHNTFMMISPSIYSACYESKVPVVQTLHNYRLLCPIGSFSRDGKVCEECMTSSLWQGVKHGCYKGSHAATATVALMLATHRLRHTWQREISCFIALSEFARDKFVEGGLSREKIFVKPNFVSPDPGARSGDGDYALFVGRLSPEKGVGTVVAAWKHLPRSIRLLIIGGGPEHEQLQAQAARDGLTNIEFKAQLPREETLAAINRARVTVIPSEWYETFCMVIAESYACSTPVICSRMGVMQELVADGRTGLHFTPADPLDLARKVEWAWAHPDEMRAMGKEARREYEAKYTAETNYPLLMNIYQRVLQGSISR